MLPPMHIDTASEEIMRAPVSNMAGEDVDEGDNGASLGPLEQTTAEVRTYICLHLAGVWENRHFQVQHPGRRLHWKRPAASSARPVVDRLRRCALIRRLS